MSSTKTLIDALSRNGKRMTRLRRSLAEVFSRAASPLSPRHILERLQARGLSTHKTSVYRELESLLEQGLIREVTFDDGQPRYERATEGHYHHIICLGCKKVDRVKLDHDLDQAERHIERRTRFRIQRHSLEFYGYCPTCR